MAPGIKIDDASEQGTPHLRRSLTLPLVVLYGLGTTVGAGIYVLIGATAAKAGIHAPIAFLFAAAVMLPSACSFAEFVGRLPVSAGEAAYVREGLKSQALSVVVGLLVVTSGVVSASALSIGSVGYLQHFVALADTALIPIVVVTLGSIAAWGILQSVAMAAVLTLIEIGGLLFIIASGFAADPDLISKLPLTVPGSYDALTSSGIFGAALLAFFAFIGFEDLVNIAEETKRPAATLAAAIFITLGVTTILYLLVASVAVLSVPIGELATATAPLSFVFERLTGASPHLISAIAIIATLNGAVIQIIMASRVIYGLSQQGSLPTALGAVHPLTQTPLVATAMVVATILLLAMLFPLEGLAKMTSRVMLIVFSLVNLALLNIKLRGEPAPGGTFVVWTWVPLVGILGCIALALIDIL